MLTKAEHLRQLYAELEHPTPYNYRKRQLRGVMNGEVRPGPTRKGERYLTASSWV